MSKPRELQPKLPVVRQSKSHNVLLLAVSQYRAGNELTHQVITQVFPQLATKGRAMEAVRHLLKHDLLSEGETPDQWKLTPSGQHVVSEIARRNTPTGTYL